MRIDRDHAVRRQHWWVARTRRHRVAESLEGATRDAGAIVLGMTKRELDELAHYESADYAPPPADWSAPPVHGFPSGGYLWPVADAEIVPVDDAAQTAGRSRGPMVKKRT